MECRFLQHIQFSSEPAGGNLLLGEIIYFHARKDIYNENGQIDPKKVDQVSRMGMNWYSRASQGIFVCDRSDGGSGSFHLANSLI